MTPFTVGYRAFEVADTENEDLISGLVLYPSHAAEEPEQLGPYTLTVSLNAPVAAGSFPLVVISHGTGGSNMSHRMLAEYLAHQGSVVLMPVHPRNNRDNNSLAGTAAILANRPRQIRLVIDWAFRETALGPSLRPNAVAVIGHSLGGYTALAVAGGEPTAFSHESLDRQARRIDVVPDERVRALVLLAPATPWFMVPGALRAVRVPILMLTAEKDSHTPSWHAESVRQGVADPTKVEYRTIANAGHFSFLSPFPPSMTSARFAPSQDPDGFDRELFHSEMNADVLDFLNRALSDRG